MVQTNSKGAYYPFLVLHVRPFVMITVLVKFNYGIRPAVIMRIWKQAFSKGSFLQNSDILGQIFIWNFVNRPTLHKQKY